MGSYTGFQFLNPLFGGTYADKVLGFKPIAYWPCWDNVGSAITQDLILPAQNGAYVGGYTLGQTGIGDGRTSVLFDGTLGRSNIYTATLGGRFNAQEGTLICWCRVGNAAVWTDGSIDLAVLIYAAAGNYVLMGKNPANNNMYGEYAGGAVVRTRLCPTGGPLTFFMMGITWSITNARVRVFYNGTKAGADLASAVWVGAVATALLGIYTGNILPWNNGCIAHVALWDRELSEAQIGILAVV